MIITKNFILINFPKTGSNFVRRRIKQLYYPKTITGKILYKLQLMPKGYKELFCEYEPELYPNVIGPHGRCYNIPEKFRHKHIVSVIRNPYERLVSEYEFRWWQKHLFFPKEELKIMFPSFPELSFKEFIRLQEMNVLKSIGIEKTNASLGPYSIKFLQFFSDNYLDIIKDETDKFFDNKSYSKYLYKVNFLHTESLNKDLYNFLLAMGYRKQNIDFILNSPHENVTKSKKKNWQSYYTPELKNEIRQKERLIFDLFPEYDN